MIDTMIDQSRACSSCVHSKIQHYVADQIPNTPIERQRARLSTPSLKCYAGGYNPDTESHYRIIRDDPPCSLHKYESLQATIDRMDWYMLRDQLHKSPSEGAQFADMMTLKLAAQFRSKGYVIPAFIPDIRWMI